MKKLEYGVYQLDQIMPCGPYDVSFETIKSTLDDSIKCHLVILLYNFARKHKKWCGVSWKVILTHVSDPDKCKLLNKILQEMVQDRLLIVYPFAKKRKGLSGFLQNRYCELVSLFVSKVICPTPELVGQILVQQIAKQKSCGFTH